MTVQAVVGWIVLGLFVAATTFTVASVLAFIFAHAESTELCETEEGRTFTCHRPIDVDWPHWLGGAVLALAAFTALVAGWVRARENVSGAGGDAR